MTLTHPDRVVYAELGFTKQDLAAYYLKVAPLMLPHIASRPLSLLRCPEGQGGECFYQKHWTDATPGIKTVLIEESGGRRPYAVVTSASDLIGLVQYGVMEFHTWQSRIDRIELPDQIILDLDPDPGVRWAEVCSAAVALRTLLADLKLKSWVKTTGGKGLHVVVPIQRRVTWEVASVFARAVAERLAVELPDHYVTVAAKAARKGRIFIDHLRNSRGATAVAPWSVRARAGAPVAMPVRWESLDRLKGGAALSVADVGALIRRRKLDPWAGMRGARQGISSALVRVLRQRF
ncbi:MAG: non-homologous end-joining DNA ligase [Gemmatimonadota bacterium]